MRARNVLGVVAAWAACVTLAGPARADKQTDELTSGYEKEAAACALQAGGVTKVADGATKLQDSLTGADHDALDGDVSKLVRARSVVDAYCSELAAALEILHANAGAKYKAIEHQLDDHDNKIRHARADAKKAIAEVEPVIHTLVPRINARVASAPPEVEHRAPVKFPSGRGVVFPALAGQWRVSGTPTSDTADYAETGKPPLAASVWTRPFDAATCEQERRAAVGATIDEHVADAAKELGVAWTAHGVVHDSGGARAVAFACLPDASPPGGWMGYVTLQPEGSPALRDALDGLMIKMLAAQAHSSEQGSGT
jgi:hypothetical protein